MNRRAALVALTTLISACASDAGLDGRNSLVNVVQEPAGSACEYGGVKIESGVDLDDSGDLDPTEVEDTQYVCDGAPGPDASLTRASEEPAGENCPGGGVKLELGLDRNGNGSLGDDEVEDTEYICSGEDGQDGQDGTDGANGTDGTSWLTATSTEPAGSNCAAGGVRVDVGPDVNENSTLDAAEVSATEYVCNGEDGQDGQDGVGGSDPAVVVTQSVARVASDGTTVTLVQASVTATGPGSIVAFAHADAFCTASGPTDHDCDSTQPIGGARIVDSTASSVFSSDGRSYFYLEPDTTEAIARTQVFDVTAAGNRTIYFRAAASTGEIGFWRNQLTLVFLPD